MDQIVVLPLCLMLFFIYKKFISKDSDRKTISDTLVVAILLTASMYVIQTNNNIITASENFRAKTNF